MTDVKSPSSPLEYRVVMRASAGFYFADLKEALVFQSATTPEGPVDVLFASRFVTLEGFNRPVRRGLRVEARGAAKSLNAAAATFGSVAQGFLPNLSFCANAASHDLEIDIVFDDTPGRTEREFFQQFVPDVRWTPHPGRPLPTAAVTSVLAAITRHADQERLHRAVVHYHHALQQWEPGDETLALAHLYMAVEALTTVAERDHLAREGIDRAELAKRWGIDWSDRDQRKRYDPSVRLNLVFGGDEQTYRVAKEASDSFEHSFKEFPEIHTLAESARDRTAQHVRRAILDVVGVDADTRYLLLNPPYDQPTHSSFTKYVRGVISGEGDNLAAADQQYPILKWRTTVQEPEGREAATEIEITFKEQLTPQLADGLSFRMTGFEVWGPHPPGQLESQVELDETNSGQPEPK